MCRNPGFAGKHERNPNSVAANQASGLVSGMVREASLGRHQREIRKAGRELPTWTPGVKTLQAEGAAGATRMTRRVWLEQPEGKS